MFKLNNILSNLNSYILQMNYKNFDAHYEKLYKLGEGSYGKVYLCQKKIQIMTSGDNISNENSHPNISNLTVKQGQKAGGQKQYYALKKLKNITKNTYSYGQNETQLENIQDLRQVQIMKSLKHQNLLDFTQIVYQDKGYKHNYYLVMPFGIQILQFAKQKQILLTKSLRKTLIHQIVIGLAQMHSQSVIHRDIKPDNIFLMKSGSVKIGDFSLSRKMPEKLESSPMQDQNRQIQNKLSGNVTTRYYRAPQIMYGSRDYGYKIDIWSLGCTIAELILHQPLFPGQTDINQLQLIFRTIGYPQQSWPKASELPYYLQFSKVEEQLKIQNILPDIEVQLLDLITNCLQLDPERRLSTLQLKSHKYFQDVAQESPQLQKLSIYLHQKKLNQILNKSK